MKCHASQDNGATYVNIQYEQTFSSNIKKTSKKTTTTCIYYTLTEKQVNIQPLSFYIPFQGTYNYSHPGVGGRSVPGTGTHH